MLPLSHISITVATIKLAEKIMLLRKVDYRWVLLGAILPDMIDKPLGWLFLHGSLFSGRFVGHTLLFVLVLLWIGIIFLIKSKNNRIVVIALSCLIHDILDAMWLYPGILYWPALGRRFPSINYEPKWISAPYSLLSETVCGIIIIIILVKLFREKHIKDFTTRGKLTF